MIAGERAAMGVGDASSPLSVSEADAIIRRTVAPAPRERVRLRQAVGRVLREEIRADRDFPPFDRVAMDGIALSSASWEAGTRRFRVAGRRPAGAEFDGACAPGDCIEVATGAALPRGCDCVVPVEALTRSDSFAEVRPGAAVAPGENVHPRGSDYRAGDLLLAEGARLAPPHLAVCAAVGKDWLSASRRPRIALVSSGDELVEVDAPVRDHQIRASNVYLIEAALASRGFPDVVRLHASDELPKVVAALAEGLATCDVAVVSGGASSGMRDHVASALEALGIEPLVRRVRQRPGMPFLFGCDARGKRVFALPGNPVASTVCAYRYLLPYLEATSGGAPREREEALLARDFRFERPLTLFLPVRLGQGSGGRLEADPRPVRGSGDFARLTESDGFLELPEEVDEFRAGTAWPLYRW